MNNLNWESPVYEVYLKATKLSLTNKVLPKNSGKKIFLSELLIFVHWKFIS